MILSSGKGVKLSPSTSASLKINLRQNGVKRIKITERRASTKRGDMKELIISQNQTTNMINSKTIMKFTPFFSQPPLNRSFSSTAFVSSSNINTPKEEKGEIKEEIKEETKGLTETKEGTNEINEVEVEKVKEKLDIRVYYISGSSFLMGMAIGIIIPVMPTFAHQIGINTLQFGAVVSMMGITRLLFNIPAAWAADRFGRKPLLVSGPILSAVGMGLTGTAQGLNELLLYRFLLGAGGSFQMTGAQLYLSDVSNPLNRARTLAPLNAAFFGGNAIGPALGGLFVDQFGIRPLFFFVGCCIGVISLNNYLSLPETIPARPEHQKSKINLRSEFSRTINQWKILFRNVDLRNALYVQCAYWFASSGCTLTMMPLFAYSHLGLSAAALGSYFTIMAIINMAGSQLGAWVLDKFGRKMGIVPGFLLLSAAVLGMMHSNTGPELLSWLILWAVGGTIFGPAPAAYVNDITTPDIRSQALAMLRSAGDLGMFLGAGLMAALAYATSIEMAMGVCSSILFFSGCRFGFFARETVVRKKK